MVTGEGAQSPVEWQQWHKGKKFKLTMIIY